MSLVHGLLEKAVLLVRRVGWVAYPHVMEVNDAAVRFEEVEYFLGIGHVVLLTVDSVVNPESNRLLDF